MASVLRTLVFIGLEQIQPPQSFRAEIKRMAAPLAASSGLSPSQAAPGALRQVRVH